MIPLMVLLVGLEGREAEARPKRIYQIPNGNLYGCRTCHIGSGNTRTQINFATHDGTREVNEGDAICASCHSDVSGGGPRNAFGREIERAFLTRSGWTGDVVWGTTLARLDSDGDGVPNGEELGDPEGMWWPDDPNPGPASRITNPGDQGSRRIVQQAPLSGEGGIRAPIQADFNGDGRVDFSDFFRFAEGFGKRQGDPGFDALLDLTGDGQVTFDDFFRFTLDFSKGAGSN